MVYTRVPAPCKGKKEGWHARLTWYRPPRPPQAPEPDQYKRTIRVRMLYSLTRNGSWGSIGATWIQKSYERSIGRLTHQSGRRDWYYYSHAPAGWLQVGGWETFSTTSEFPLEYSSLQLSDGTTAYFAGAGSSYIVVDEPTLPPVINPVTGTPTTLWHDANTPGKALVSLATFTWIECDAGSAKLAEAFMRQGDNPAVGYVRQLDAYFLDPNNPDSPPPPSGGYGGRPPDTQNLNEILSTKKRDSRWQIAQARYLVDTKYKTKYFPSAPSDEHKLVAASFQFCGCAEGEHECGGCCLACCEIARMMTEKTDPREWM